MSKIASSELIINSDGSVFHLHIRPEELAETVILVGDPDRVEMIGSFFESQEFVRHSREFNVITGRYNGKRISVISTGIGCDNIDIVMNELDALVNVDFTTREVKSRKQKLTILRIGTCGAIQSDIPLGSYVFSQMSIGFDGLLNWYGGRENVAQIGIEEAFLQHVGWNKYLPIPYFVNSSPKLIELFKDSTVPGLTISSPGFYGPQLRVVRLPLVIPSLLEKLRSFRYEGRKITNFEMESSGIAGLAAQMGHDAATICLVIANRYAGDSNPDYKILMKNLVKMSLDKLSTL